MCVCVFSFRRLLLCRVTLGKPVEQLTSVRIAHAPPGHHSVIGRPSAGGLTYPEYVIYRGEQVCGCHHLMSRVIMVSLELQAYPEFVISFTIMKPEDTKTPLAS